MRKMWKTGAVWMLGAAFVAMMFAGSVEQAEARPPFVGVFGKKYTNLADQVKAEKCAVCHPKEDNKKKKKRNAYGKALEKALGEKNVKDKEKVAEMMTKIESEKSAIDGKTFGDLIKEGKLPGSTE